jgi:hypothetical protein
MNITPIQRSITEYHLALSAEDAQAWVDHPWDQGEKLAEQLRAAGVAPSLEANGNGHKPKAKPGPRSQFTIGRGAKKTSPKGNKSSTEKIQCELCPRKIARKFMPKHLATKHGSETTPAPAAAGAAE